ncbi:MAG: class I SAM-dependent methyltransferase [Clostridia bacterium]|nr:class I SAM-dependent methyltransferase [Clostridia bacterium]
MKYTQQNAATIDSWKEKYGLFWMEPLSHEDYVRAAAGEEILTLTPQRKVPFSWYGDCRGKKILGLAAGGGQQMAVMAALGAQCTLFDLSKTQIESDRMVSEREGYPISLVRGDMTEPLPFADGSFDMVINPVSNHYIEDVYPVFREIYRVLKPGGTFLAGLDTGIYWAFAQDGNGLIHRLPFNPLKDESLRRELEEEDMSLVFSHTMEEQIGGQLKAGFILRDLLEDTNEAGAFFDYNVPTFILTRAVK